jgi:hypothetical protein
MCFFLGKRILKPLEKEKMVDRSGTSIRGYFSKFRDCLQATFAEYRSANHGIVFVIERSFKRI